MCIVFIYYQKMTHSMCQVSLVVKYEGHLESSKHGIITPQCVDKMLSNNTFLETRIKQLLGVLFLSKKDSATCSACPKGVGIIDWLKS